jgi:type IV pilus biogenesis protein CpaD/CtpE
VRQRVAPADVEVVAADPSPYGTAGPATVRAIDLLARTDCCRDQPLQGVARGHQPLTARR